MFNKTIVILSRPMIFLACLLSIHCGPFAPNEPTTTKATISASIKIAHTGLSPESLTKIEIQVSGEGIDTITKELTLEAGGARGAVEVPTGKNLLFTATAYMQATAVLSGNTEFQAEKGKSNSVQIKLDFLVPALILTPPDTSVKKNDDFTIYLQTRHVTDLMTVGTQISFDPSKLQVTDLGREDDFLKSNSGSINQLSFTKDNTSGTIDVVLGIFPATDAVNGNGKIARITFKALDVGTANLNVLLDSATNPDWGLYDKNASLINTLPLGSSIIIQ